MAGNIGEKIREIRLKRGLTIEQLAERIGLTPSVISKYEKGKLGIDIDRLIDIAKALRVDPNIFLSGEAKIVDIPKAAKTIPLYSLPVSAGNGMFPDEVYVIDHIVTHRFDVDFAVKVEGDSMEPIVPDGAIILVRKTQGAKDGDMILCTYDDHVFVKWFHKDGGEIYLVSENQQYAPIRVDPKEGFIIHGVVMGVIYERPKKRFK